MRVEIRFSFSVAQSQNRLTLDRYRLGAQELGI